MTGCPGRDELLQFLGGQLAPAAEEAVLAHLDGCEACTQALDALTNASAPRLPAAPAAGNGPGLSASFLKRLMDGPASGVGTATAGHPAGPLPPAVGSGPRSWGAYEIVGELGRGGMGVVYKARQAILKRWVALKVITAAGDPAGRERFRREAEAAAALQHPHIVQVYEVGEHDGLPYLALEYVEGGTLAEFLAGTPQEPAAAASLVETLAGAMQHAHERGILHRDLKPANVLLQRKTTTDHTDHTDKKKAGTSLSVPSVLSVVDLLPKITDFGLAKLIADPAGPTRSGEAVGTPSYMAPEQALGGMPFGPATDVYALGAVLYEMLTGRPPFKAASPLMTLDLVVHQEPPPPSSLVPRIPRDLQTICLKCLHKDPARRYATAGELADDLRRFLQNRPIQARPVGRLERAGKWARRRPAVAALGAAVVAVTLLGLAGIVWQWRTAVAARDAADWQAYRANLAAAAADLDLFNVQACRRHLEDVPGRLQDTWEWRHFNSRLQGPLRVLRGHAGPVGGVCFSPDGSRLLSFANDGTLRLWDRASGQALATLRGPPGAPVGFGAFTPDGRRIVGAGAGLRVWDARAGGPVASLAGLDPVLWPALSPDGSRLAAATPRGVKLWDIESGRERATLEGGTPEMRLAWGPDGAWIAGAAHDTVRLWDARTGALATTLRLPGAAAYTVAFSPTGALLAVGGDYPESGVHVIDCRARALRFSLTGHRNRVTSLAFSPDETRLASASLDETVRLWDVASGRLLYVLPGHRGAAESVSFRPDGKRLLTPGHDGALRIWDTDSGELVAALLGHTDTVWAARYSPDGRWIASASADHSVLLWDAAQMERSGGLRGHTGFVYDVAVSADGRRIASAAWDGTVRLWDGTTGAAGRVLPAEGYLLAVAFSPDGRRVAAGSQDGRLWVWDADSGAVLLERRLPVLGGIRSLAYRPDGRRRAAAVGNDLGLPTEPGVHILDAADGAEVAVLGDHGVQPLPVRYTPDGRRVVAGGIDGALRVWDAETGTLVATLKGHGGAVRALAWSAGGRLLASGGDDHAVRLWDAATGKPLGELPHASIVFGVAFSPDGTRLAAACEDNTIRLWDLATRDEVAELRGHTAYVHALVFSPDGTRLISGSGDYTVRIWDTQARPEGAE